MVAKAGATPAHESRLNDCPERAESILTSVVAIILILFVLVAIVTVFVEVRAPLFDDHDFTAATLAGIDAAFLVIILLELLHTTLSRGPISEQLQEFLVIGVTATIRHGLGVAATRGDPRDIVIDLAINSVSALVLVVALWLVRTSCAPTDARHAPKDRASIRPMPGCNPCHVRKPHKNSGWAGSR